MARTKQSKIDESTLSKEDESIIEEIEYKIEELKNTSDKSTKVTFVQHLKHTSIFTDQSYNGIELKTIDKFLSLKRGDIIEINL